MSVVKNPYAWHLAILRITAIVSVLAAHVALKGTYVYPFGSVGWDVMKIYDTAFRFAIPIFFMVSGALFLNPDKAISIKTLYKKNILRIFTALVFWTLFYNTFKYFYDNPTGLSFLSFFLETYNHLWFLYSLLGIYIMIPILKPFVASKDACLYFVLLYFAVIFIYKVAALLSYLDVGPDGMYIFVREFLYLIQGKFMFGLTVYFVLGYYLNTNSLKKNTVIFFYICSVIGFILAVYFHMKSPTQEAAVSDILFGQMSPYIAVYSISFFLFFKKRFAGYQPSARAVCVIKFISDHSFGVYLTHAFFLVLIGEVYYKSSLPAAILIVPAATAVVLLLSFIATVIIKKIPVLKKYIV